MSTRDWAGRAVAFVRYAVAAHNATVTSDDPILQAACRIGGAINFSLSVEFALKALLESDGVPIDGKLRTHKLHVLFERLNHERQESASAIYQGIISFDQDERIQRPPINDLAAFLRIHNDAFTKWRYDLENAGVFFPVLMMYAAFSILTLVDPKQSYRVGSATSRKVVTVLGGRVIPDGGDAN